MTIFIRPTQQQLLQLPQVCARAPLHSQLLSAFIRTRLPTQATQITSDMTVAELKTLIHSHLPKIPPRRRVPVHRLPPLLPAALAQGLAHDV